MLVFIMGIFLTTLAHAGIEERFDALPDAKIAAHLCGYSEGNMAILKKTIADQNDEQKIACMESKTSEVAAIVNDGKQKEDGRRDCLTFFKTVNENAMTAAQKDQVIKCLVKLRR